MLPVQRASCPLFLAVLLLFACRATCLSRHPLGPYKRSRVVAQAATTGGDADLLRRCSLHWHNATLDHFSFAEPEKGPGWFLQRYYLCAEHWRRPTPSPHAPGAAAAAASSPGPIFFYVGNEADVTLYLNHTGLMWENAPAFGALLVFAEHRYYGQSKPFRRHLRGHMGYLTAEQALADYAQLITRLKADLGAQDSPVIGFGGSYGGMLATWFRLKYPHILDGAIAASAPIWNFVGLDPPADEGYFSRGVTYDASPEGGSPPACVPNVKRSWQVLAALAASRHGRERISRAMRLCPSSRLNKSGDALALRDWISSAWDYMAMGDFPYPSSYMLNGGGTLPAYPVRVACAALAEPIGDDDLLLEAMAEAVGTFYNYSGTAECNDFASGPNPETDEDSNFWDLQWCSEMYMPQTRDGEIDMFWPEPFNDTAAALECRKTWGVMPRRHWAVIEFGGRRIAAASNIVFSNGLLDPWHGGGVMSSLSPTLVAVVIPEGAHHLDLMFSNELDPPSVKAARAVELAHMWRWVREAEAAAAKRRRTAAAAAAAVQV